MENCFHRVALTSTRLGMASKPSGFQVTQDLQDNAGCSPGSRPEENREGRASDWGASVTAWLIRGGGRHPARQRQPQAKACEVTGDPDTGRAPASPGTLHASTGPRRGHGERTAAAWPSAASLEDGQGQSPGLQGTLGPCVDSHWKRRPSVTGVWVLCLFVCSTGMKASFSLTCTPAFCTPYREAGAREGPGQD